MNDNLIKIASELVNPISLNGNKDNRARSVGCALLTVNGNIYTGISINMTCGLGFCAEAAAIAEMLKAGETKIAKIVAFHKSGKILSPCGRCREMMYQTNTDNINTEIILDHGEVKTLGDLLPYYCWA
ncbi:MAG: hypothetical protein LBK26_00310 [Rickettsiales bacterium]|jgi:cytidine deaminase|nr:hypothetical protein [Rickettsiales bacterium]